jgi:hypothetical protein
MREMAPGREPPGFSFFSGGLCYSLVRDSVDLKMLYLKDGWAVTPSSLLEVYLHVAGACCLHHQHYKA